MGFLASVAMAMVPLLIAIDPAASITVLLSLEEGADIGTRHRILRDAVFTALAVGIGFLFLGEAVFRLLGIDKADFQIGGGLILVVLSLADLVAGDRARRRRDEFVGVVPMGTPLIVGPAVLTALTVLQHEYGTVITMTSLVAALVLTAVGLALADRVQSVIGTAGLKAVSKIISILLAGFGVHLVRLGVMEILAHAAR